MVKKQKECTEVFYPLLVCRSMMQKKSFKGTVVKLDLTMV